MIQFGGLKKHTLPLSHQWEMQPEDKAMLLPAQVMLQQVPEGFQSRHTALSLRHPIGAYNLSIQSVIARGLRLVHCLTTANSKGADDRDEVVQLLEAADAFLDSLMEHLDDCKKILICFLSDSSEHKKLLRSYLSKTGPYRDLVGELVNYLKHEQGRLFHLTMRAADSVTYGYFVASARPDESIGPHGRLHNGGFTAFSFNRDIRFHIASIIAVSSILAEHISFAVDSKDTWQIQSTDGGNSDFWDLFKKVAELQTTVFPDELLEDWPRIQALPEQHSGIWKCTCQMPSTSKHGMPYSYAQGQFNATMSGDGYTRQFQMPYMGNKFWHEFARSNYNPSQLKRAK